MRPAYKLVDTCAAEFEAYTPYFYSTYEMEDEVPVEQVDKVMIIGGGPNRIGQGIEFDYCCCQASFALRERGVQSIMVNCNPETVSTDYDTSDRLYFEPLTVEDVANIYDKERPARGNPPVRRPDAAQHGARPRGARRAGARHGDRCHRPRRGSQPVPRDAAGPGTAPAGQRHRAHGR